MRKMLCAAAALLTLGAAGVYFANRNMEAEIVTAPAPPQTYDVPPPSSEPVAPVATTPETFEPILVETSATVDDVLIRSAGETVGTPRETHPGAASAGPRPDTGHARHMPYADEQKLSWLAQVLKTPLESILTSHDAGLLPRGVFGGEEESEEGRRQR